MTGRKPFKDLTKGWSASRKAQVAEKTAAMETELNLATLRKALGVSQTDLAEALGRSQGAISQLENRDDVTLSLLKKYIEGMGGTLKVSAEFPDATIPIGVGS